MLPGYCRHKTNFTLLLFIAVCTAFPRRPAISMFRQRKTYQVLSCECFGTPTLDYIIIRMPVSLDRLRQNHRCRLLCARTCCVSMHSSSWRSSDSFARFPRPAPKWCSVELFVGICVLASAVLSGRTGQGAIVTYNSGMNDGWRVRALTSLCVYVLVCVCHVTC